MTTIEEAKEYLKQHIKQGVACPVCTQYVKQYTRPLNSSMAYVLVLVYNYFKMKPHDDWLHVENYLNELNTPAPVRGDFPKLKYWNLIEDKKSIREDGSNRNGYYKITEDGKLFVESVTKIYSHAIIFNGKCYGFQGKHIDIREALNNKFSYEEIIHNEAVYFM